MKLHNTVDRRILKERIANSPIPRVTVSFYAYWPIQNPSFFRDFLYLHWSAMGILGRTYIAHEGINAQISVPEGSFRRFKEHLYGITFLDGVRLNVAVQSDPKAFYALKVKLRKKIVADGLEDPNFNPSLTGKHLRAQEFNDLTAQEGTILIDMRNHYESEVGHFQGAVLPDADTFREEIGMVEDMLKGKMEENIVMYCTGGIRCEKASAYLKYKGFKNVHQLEGGIIKYVNDVKAEGLDNRFKGVNFVFDERLSERISEDVIAQCHQCGVSCDTHINCMNLSCHILFIQCAECKAKYESCCSEECKSVKHLSEEEQKTLRRGKPAVRNVFKKGRSEKLLFKKTGAKVLEKKDSSPH